MTAPPEGACGPVSTQTIELADTLYLGGRSYHQIYNDSAPETITVGPLYAVTTCRLHDGLPVEGAPTPEGAAAHLPPDTPLHEIGGQDPTFRIAALTEGETILFQSLAPTADGPLGQVALHAAVGVDFVEQGSSTAVAPVPDPTGLIQSLIDAAELVPDPELLYCDWVNLSLLLHDGSRIGVILYPAAGAVSLEAGGYLTLPTDRIESLTAQAPDQAVSPGSPVCRGGWSNTNEHEPPGGHVPTTASPRRQ